MTARSQFEWPQSKRKSTSHLSQWNAVAPLHLHQNRIPTSNPVLTKPQRTNSSLKRSYVLQVTVWSSHPKTLPCGVLREVVHSTLKKWQIWMRISTLIITRRPIHRRRCPDRINALGVSSQGIGHANAQYRNTFLEQETKRITSKLHQSNQWDQAATTWAALAIILAQGCQLNRKLTSHAISVGSLVIMLGIVPIVEPAASNKYD